MEKILKKISTFFAIFIFLFFPILPQVSAYQFPLVEAKAVISDSEPQATGVEYRFEFTTSIALSANQIINVIFPDEYAATVANPGDITCPVNMTASVTARIIVCTVNSGQTHPAGQTEITAANIANPAKESGEGTADIHFIAIETDADEGAEVMVAIIEAFKVRAEISPILNFEVGGVEAGESVHGNLTGVTTTSVLIPFGVMEPEIPVLAAQDLFVTTNAKYGFTVNVFQDGDLRTIADYRIYCFIEGECVNYTNPSSWASPQGDLGVFRTYGHFGITSEDESLGTGCAENYYDFGGMDNWAGLNGTAQAEVMRHCQPADSQVRHEGRTRLGFQVEISFLQPGGEYENILTYIVTPTF